MHCCGSAVLHAAPFIVGRVTPLNQRRSRVLALLQEQHTGYKEEALHAVLADSQQQADMTAPSPQQSRMHVYSCCYDMQPRCRQSHTNAQAAVLDSA